MSALQDVCLDLVAYTCTNGSQRFGSRLPRPLASIPWQQSHGGVQARVEYVASKLLRLDKPASARPAAATTLMTKLAKSAQSFVKVLS